MVLSSENQTFKRLALRLQHQTTQLFVAQEHVIVGRCNLPLTGPSLVVATLALGNRLKTVFCQLSPLRHSGSLNACHHVPTWPSRHTATSSRGSPSMPDAFVFRRASVTPVGSNSCRLTPFSGFRATSYGTQSITHWRGCQLLSRTKPCKRHPPGILWGIEYHKCGDEAEAGHASLSFYPH